MKPSPKKLTGIILCTTIGVFAFTKLTTDIVKNKKIRNHIQNNYPVLEIQDEVDETVASIYHYPSDYRQVSSVQTVKLSNGQGYTIYMNFSLTDDLATFKNTIKPGVTIKKNALSDTIRVVDGNKENLFLIH